MLTVESYKTISRGNEGWRPIYYFYNLSYISYHIQIIIYVHKYLLYDIYKRSSEVPTEPQFSIRIIFQNRPTRMHFHISFQCAKTVSHNFSVDMMKLLRFQSFRCKSPSWPAAILAVYS